MEPLVPDISLRLGVPNDKCRGTAKRPGTPLKAHDSAIGGQQDPSQCSHELQTLVCRAKGRW